jgi:hypothetical protein
MTYKKPELKTIGGAADIIQSGMSKTDSHADAFPPVNPPNNATATAYEADE